MNGLGRLPAVLVLAAGRGVRYRAAGGSGDKLQAMLAGKPVLQHVLAAVQASGLPCHLEQGPYPGMGDSIAAAVRARCDAPGWLILPGDLPLVRPDTILAVAQALQHGSVVVPRHHGERGHPVGFAAAWRDDLLALTGEAGARSLVQRAAQTGRLQHVDVDDVGMLADIDTPQALSRAVGLLEDLSKEGKP
jgi:molybdenum cofactor cytidylyltransferase